MASHRRPKQPSRTRVSVLTATAAAAVALTSQGGAQAAPKPDKDQVQSKVDKLNNEAEAATEKYDGAKEKQKKLEKEISDLQDKVARGQSQLNDERDNLGSFATAQYRDGGIDPSVQLFLSSNPDDYLDKASTLDQLSGQQVEMLTKIQAKQRTLAQERKEAQSKLKDLAATRTELNKKKTEVQKKLAEAQRLLNTLTEQQREEIARKQQEAALKAAGIAGNAHGSGRAGAAFAAGQTRIGDPYVFGASGPSSFDCSGFTSWAYAQAGVSIPRTSQAQANAGTRIYSISQLQVGDLVIMNNLDHVGLYAGNGQVLHAPHTGTVVKYESISDMQYDFGVRV